MKKTLFIFSVFIAVFFGYISSINNYLYSEIHLHTDDGFRYGGAIRVEGEYVGKEIIHYEGNYSDYVEFYLRFLSDLRSGKNVEEMVTKNSESKLEAYRELISDGDKIWSNTKLISVALYDNKLVGLLEHELINRKYKPIRLFTVRVEGGVKKVVLASEEDLVQHELIYEGFFAKENTSDISFMELYEKLSAELSSYFCGTRISVGEDVMVLISSCFNDDSVNKVIVDAIEKDSLLASEFYSNGYLSIASKNSISSWLEKMDMELKDVRVSRIFGRDMRLLGSYKVGEDCIINNFTLGDFDKNKLVVVCSGKVVSALSNSGFNKIYESIFLER